jgi:hypothetical protein
MNEDREDEDDAIKEGTRGNRRFFRHQLSHQAMLPSLPTHCGTETG